jgi:nucleotide-binding universal stress UspA family protein
MYKHILLSTDGSELSRKAENECVSFAKAIGAKVTAIHVVSHFYLHIQPWGAPSSVHRKIEKEHEAEATELARKMISQLEARAKSQGVRLDTLVAIGDHPYEEIINNAAKLKCDLIMMASHGHTGINSMLLGSETAKVLTHTKIPVLVVR